MQNKKLAKIALEIEYLFKEKIEDVHHSNIARIKSSFTHRNYVKLINHFEMIDSGNTVHRIMYIQVKDKHYIVFLNAQKYYENMHKFFKFVEIEDKATLKHLALNIRKHI